MTSRAPRTSPNRDDRQDGELWIGTYADGIFRTDRAATGRATKGVAQGGDDIAFRRLLCRLEVPDRSANGRNLSSRVAGRSAIGRDPSSRLLSGFPAVWAVIALTTWISHRWERSERLFEALATVRSLHRSRRLMIRRAGRQRALWVDFATECLVEPRRGA